MQNDGQITLHRSGNHEILIHIVELRFGEFVVTLETCTRKQIRQCW